MKCPICRSSSLVIDKKDSCQSIHRKHKCKECGFIFYSYERLIYEADMFNQAAKRCRKKRKDAKK